MNEFRNELEIEMAGQKILLRPTFENMATMEAKMGGIASLAFKYGAKLDLNNLTPSSMAETCPPATDSAQIIYFNQLEKKYSLDEILEMIFEEGVIKVGVQILPFLMKMMAGNKHQPKMSESEKKN